MEDAKRTKLEYYIANIDNECWDRIQPYLITNMSINSCRALTLLCTRSHNLGIKVALWNQNKPNIMVYKVCKEWLV